MGGSTIWLVGMMGVGKTSVGRALAVRLGLEFFDADEAVERASGARVSEIFEREGERGFRRRERQAISELAGREAVVALGGGALTNPGVPSLLAETGRVVYLRADPETLLERVGGGDDRPLLAGLDAAGRLERLRDLLREREIHYGSARFVVSADDGDAEEVAARVARALEPADEAGGEAADENGGQGG